MSNKTLHPAATVIPHGFFINRPVGYTDDGLRLYPSFAPVPLTKEQAIARVQVELETTETDSVQFRLLTETLERLTGRYIPQPTVDVDALADALIEIATEHLEDQFGNIIDVSDVLDLFDGAVQTDVIDAVSRRLIGKDTE